MVLNRDALKDRNLLDDIDDLREQISILERYPPNKTTITFLVAANNAHSSTKAQADYVCDGINDQSEIQAAIDALPSDGGQIILSEGTFITEHINISKSNVSLIGAGRNATILKCPVAFGTNGVIRGILQLGYANSITNFTVQSLGFDTTASNDTTVMGPNAIWNNYFISHCRFVDLSFELSMYSAGILLEKMAGGHNITIRDIYSHNGAGDVFIAANASGEYYGVVIDNVHSLVDDTGSNDDRIAIVAHQGGEARDITVSNIKVEVVSGATGGVNGVKLDTGTNGYVHNVHIRDVYMTSIAGITNNNPVTCLIGSGGTMQDILIDGVDGYKTGGIILRMNRVDYSGGITIRNIRLIRCQDTLACLEIYAAMAPNDEHILIENCVLDSVASISGNKPIGILLTSGSAAQGGAIATISNCALRNVQTGITNNLDETGATQATSWDDVRTSDSVIAANVPFNMVNTWEVTDCPGYNPRGYSVTQPAVPASGVSQTNTTGVDCTVFVTGGTVTAIAIGGTNTGLTSGSFRVPVGQTINLTYSAAPTWTWFGD